MMSAYSEYVVTGAEMKRCDSHIINRIGVPSMVLMERAALAVADELFADASLCLDRVACLCGAGNNGGDGFAVARLLGLKGISVKAIFVGDEARCTSETSQQMKILENYGVQIIRAGFGCGAGGRSQGNPYSQDGQGSQEARCGAGGRSQGNPCSQDGQGSQEARCGAGAARGRAAGAWPSERAEELIASATLIVDALFGVGLVRPLEGAFKNAVECCNASPAKIVSIDMPSGVSADTGEVLGAAIKADKTVVLAYQKVGLTLEPGREYAGEATVKDIGITDIGFGGVLPARCGTSATVEALYTVLRLKT